MNAPAGAVVVYLGLGSNLGDRGSHLRTALERLTARGVIVLRSSPFYETEPWGVLDQPRFLNAACSARTACPPHELLSLLQGLEREMGRRRTIRYGPRPIDLDILLYDELCIDTPTLTVPHAGMLQRASVLVPLADIAPQFQHPVTGLTVAQHLAALGEISGLAPYPPGLSGGS